MGIQERIQHLMDERGWSSYKLAKRAGLSETTVTNIFTRNNEPTFHTLAAICSAFGVTMSCFFAEEGEPIILTEEQKLLLTQWSTLNEKQKNILLELIGNI